MVLGRLQRLLVFPRFAALPDPEAGRGLGDLERWKLDTPDGPVEAWFLPAPGASASSPAPAVVFAHGNAELIDYWGHTLDRYRALGLSVLLPEYRGYGRSAGRPSQRAIASDFGRWLDRLRERPDVDAARIVYHGRSIGGGVVCDLARARPPAAMILMSTFTSLASIAGRYGLRRRWVEDPFDNLEVVQRLPVPVLVVHGSRDRLVPTAHGRRLAEAAPDARLVLYDADHNDCPPDWERFFADARAFLVETRILGDAAV